MSFSKKVNDKFNKTAKRDYISSLGTVYQQYLDRCETYWKEEQSQYGKNMGFEVAKFRNVNNNADIYEKKGGMVVLGFNPSGAYLGTNATHPKTSTPNFYEYDPFVNGPIAIDQYTKTVEQFATECDFADNHYILKAFGIVGKTQSALENKIINNSGLYEPVFQLPISAIIKLEPKIVVFANNVLRRLIIDNGLFSNTVTNYAWLPNNCVYDMVLKDADGNTTKCNALFTTMLDKDHLDKGSRELIVQVIKNLP